MNDCCSSFCNSPEHIWRPNRREFLFVGLVGSLGLTLGELFKLQAQSAGAKARAQSVINIFLPGGIAAQESFDPKLLAPIEYRGPLGAVKTRLESVYFSEQLKRTAEIADKICVIRSMTHGEADHDRGTHNMFTGWRPSPAVQYPSIGSIVSHELGSRNDLPPYVCIPNQPNSFAGTGFLGSAYGPFSLGADPGNGAFKVRDLNLPSGVDDKRFAERREMRSVIDAHFGSLEKSDALAGMDAFYQRAYAMMSSDKARAAFDLKQEPDKLRDDYGRNTAGQRMLLARRLVESGVRFVSLTYGGWDHHDNIRNGVTSQMPSFDQAFAALIRDLDTRGMLDSTLVLVTTEFGRTPKVNGTAGRDHYPKVFSIVMAGGGIKQGCVHGSTDPTGSEPDSDPLTVPDYAATIYHLLGIDWEKTLLAGTRPVKIVKDGEIAHGLLA
ncbi:MAG TPA: DUF1501 domain-containing protein [Candidatus Binatia bacterium]|jgi:hypothetical protein|nr:DUF1501 domain-containing protein [Candidatus Binatia bacterium]